MKIVKMTAMVFFAAIFAMSTYTGCKSTNFPDEKQIIKDSVGQTFFYYYNWGSGGEQCTLKEGQVTSVNIEKDKTISDSKNGTLTYVVELSAKLDNALILGEMEIGYSKFDQGWKIQYMKSVDAKQGSSFDMRMKNGQE